MCVKRIPLVVIGAGPGGYPAAFLAADKGLEVTLIDQLPNPGGVCLYRGCIPTKTLIHVTQVIHDSQEAKNWGVTFEKPQVDLDELRAWKTKVIQKIAAGTGQLCKQRSIPYIQGSARFLDVETLSIQKNDGSTETMKFEKAIIATGSIPGKIPNMNIASPQIMFSAEAIEIKDIPEKFLVIGGGFIGLEMGTFYSTLGSQVTIVEMMPNILPGADDDLVRTYSMTARKRFHAILPNTTVVDMKEENNQIRVTLKDKNDQVQEQQFDKVLVTIGRIPNSKDLGLENTKVQMDERGFIQINLQCQTDEPAIYAIGDVVGGDMLAHKATHEGKTAIENILGNTKPFTPKAIPAVLYTDPEVAWCGVTENEAKERGLEYTTAKFPWAASGRSTSLGRMDGVTKLIVDTKTEVILGIGLVGPGVSELISEGALAIENGLKAEDLAHTIHPHPTLSETLMEAADIIQGVCTHVYRPKR